MSNTIKATTPAKTRTEKINELNAQISRNCAHLSVRLVCIAVIAAALADGIYGGAYFVLPMTPAIILVIALFVAVFVLTGSIMTQGAATVSLIAQRNHLLRKELDEQYS